MPIAAKIGFVNVRIFDGSDRLSEPSDVTIRDGLIASIEPHRAGEESAAGGVDGTGCTLIPGLIDAHWHSAFAAIATADAMTADPGYLHVLAGVTAGQTLLRGFTSVRDAGGPVFGLKRAIDSGVIQGPRIFPSGAFISQTGGHGDFRLPYEVPRGVISRLSHIELVGASVIADGEVEVLRGAREQLMHGASQLKIMCGGGVSSSYDPLDVTQYTDREVRAAVEAAESWGTYVMAHVYTSQAAQQAIKAGVKSIEHGHLLDEKTVALMAEQGIWWSLQPFLDDEDLIPVPAAVQPKQRLMTAGTDTAYHLAIKHGVKLAWGTDTLFDAKLATRQGAQLAKMTRWFTPAEVLRMATSDNAELLSLSGPRNPYPGALGTVTVGAHADLVLVRGNPLEDITLIANPGPSFSVIMKAGHIIKNTTMETAT